MFSRRLLNPTKSVAKSVVAPTQRRAKSTQATVPGFLYNNVWMKSTPLYVGYIFAGAVVVELFFGIATDAMFGLINKGVSFFADSMHVPPSLAYFSPIIFDCRNYLIIAIWVSSN